MRSIWKYGHQLGSSSSLVSCPCWIRRKDTLATPEGAPGLLGYVKVQPRHTHKCILPAQEHKNAKNMTSWPQPNKGVGWTTAAQTSLSSETVWRREHLEAAPHLPTQARRVCGLFSRPLGDLSANGLNHSAASNTLNTVLFSRGIHAKRNSSRWVRHQGLYQTLMKPAYKCTANCKAACWMLYTGCEQTE